MAAAAAAAEAEAAAAVSDREAMQAAIQLSERAGLQERTGRCFGAVVVKDGQIVGQGYNQVRDTLIALGSEQSTVSCVRACVCVTLAKGFSQSLTTTVAPGCYMILRRAVVVKDGPIVGRGYNQVCGGTQIVCVH
jgi:pyrimidine deaminase RibD-like protein